MKAALVEIDTQALEAILGLPPFLRVHAAQVYYRSLENPFVQLVLTGDSLADVFHVEPGQVLRKATIVVHTEERFCDILPTPEGGLHG